MSEEIREAVQIIEVAYDGIEIAMKVGSGGIAAMQKAIDFLKGIDEEAFRMDFERALQEHKSRHEQYVVRWRDVYCILEYGEIFYIEAYNRHLFIHTETEGYECVGKLTEDCEKLKPYHFSRCHQGYLVNLNKIKRINKASIKLKNDVEIPVSRGYRAGVMEAFNLYLAGRQI